MTRALRTTAAVALLGAFGCGGGSSMTSGAAPAAPQTPETPAAAAPATAAMATAGGAATLASGAYTAAQAEKGQADFRTNCAECHDASEMRGSDFMFEWEGSSVGRLFRYISRTMPDDKPGTLSEETYLAVVSYILKMNDFPAGETALTADEETLNGLTIQR